MIPNGMTEAQYIDYLIMTEAELHQDVVIIDKYQYRGMLFDEYKDVLEYIKENLNK